MYDVIMDTDEIPVSTFIKCMVSLWENIRKLTTKQIIFHVTFLATKIEPTHNILYYSIVNNLFL